mgnify:CR=1 FL=1
MKQFIYDSWNGIMNANHNPLKHIDDLQVRHIVLQTLAWMWCIAFSLMIGDLMFFGTSVIAHMVLIAAIVVTVSTFETAKRRPQTFNFIKGYHSMGRSRGYIWTSGPDGQLVKTKLPAGDPGGEHE